MWRVVLSAASIKEKKKKKVLFQSELWFSPSLTDQRASNKESDRGTAVYKANCFLQEQFYVTHNRPENCRWESNKEGKYKAMVSQRSMDRTAICRILRPTKMVRKLHKKGINVYIYFPTSQKGVLKKKKKENQKGRTQQLSLKKPKQINPIPSQCDHLLFLNSIFFPPTPHLTFLTEK